VLREEWDLPMVAAMNRYWKQFPPIDVLAAAYLDYKPMTDPDEFEPISRHSLIETSKAFDDADMPAHLREAWQRIRSREESGQGRSRTDQRSRQRHR
jgi:hypothetical protein